MGAFLNVFWATIGVISALWVAVVFGYCVAFMWRGILRWGRQKNCEHYRIRVSYVAERAASLGHKHIYSVKDAIYGKCIDCGVVVDGRVGSNVVGPDDIQAMTDKMFERHKLGKTEIVSRETKVEGGDGEMTAKGECPVCHHVIAERRGETVLADKLWCSKCDMQVHPVWSAIQTENGHHEVVKDDDANRRCRVCHCTDIQDCLPGCWWVADDLCSECAPENVSRETKVGALEDGFGIVAGAAEDFVSRETIAEGGD